MVVMVMMPTPALVMRRGGRGGRERAEQKRQTDGAANQKPLHRILLGCDVDARKRVSMS